MTEFGRPGNRGGQLRTLGVEDLEEACALLDRDPWSNVFLRHRVGNSRTAQRWLGADVWGWFEDGRLVSMLHLGSNVVPAQATPEAVNAFVSALRDRGSKPASLVGPAETVTSMWSALADEWGPAHLERLDQPLLVIDEDPQVPLDRRVRQVLMDELDIYYPACVEMFVEELGFHPERDNPAGYRARVAQLVANGWAWAVIEKGQVLFKAEVGATGPQACQVQGVWTNPAGRNRGMGTRAMAAVVQQVRRHVAPDVTLYVNAHNTAARALYENVGFRQVGTFASILF